MSASAPKTRKRDIFKNHLKARLPGRSPSPSVPDASKQPTSTNTIGPKVDRLHEEAFAEFQTKYPNDAELLKVYIDPKTSVSDVQRHLNVHGWYLMVLLKKTGDILLHACKALTLSEILDSQWHKDTEDFMVSALEDAKSKRLKVQLTDGKVLIVGDVIGKCVSWVQKMVAVGDTAVQYDPVHAALPWAAFRFVLQGVVNYHEAEAAVWEGIEKVCNDLVWINLQEILYLGKSLLLESQLRKTFIAFYMTLYMVLAKYLDRIHKSRLSKLLLSPFVSESSFRECLSETDQIKVQIEHFSLQADREAQLDQSADIKLALSRLEGLGEPMARIQAINEELYSRLEECKCEDVSKWVSDIPYADHFSRVHAKALDGTGKWLFDSEEYTEWLKSSNAEVLRLHGKAGSGKSTVFSLVVDKLQHESRTQGIPPPVYFYCARTSDEPQRAQPLQILRCLLRQLAFIPGSNRIQQAVLERYERRRDEGELKEKEVVELCIRSIDSRGPTSVLVDALDESDPLTRGILLGGLIKMLKKSMNVVKVFVTSRDDRHESPILDYPEFVIMPQSNMKDIENYVSCELDRLTSEKLILGGHVSSELSGYIVAKMSEKADGMFRWAALQLQALEQFEGEDDMREHLGNLPADLTDSYWNVYELEMKHMDRYKPKNKEVAVRVFKWLLVAQEQLDSNEFCTLVGHVDTSKSPKSLKLLVQYCFSFVEYDEPLDTFRFCHLSVREFFESAKFRDAYPDFVDASIHASIAASCLKFTLDEIQSNIASSNYAVAYWTEHAWKAGELRRSPPLQAAIKRILSPSSPMFRRWLLSLGRAEKDMNFSACRDTSSIRRLSPLMVASMWGFHELVPELAEKESMESLASMTFRAPLRRDSVDLGLLGYAAWKGHLQVLEALFDLDMNLEDTECSEVDLLEAAGASDSIDVARLVLRRSGRRYGTARLNTILRSTTKYGKINVQFLQMLLDAGAEIDGRDEGGETALLIASEMWYTDAVKLLLRLGAAIGVKDDNGKDALYRACEKGRYYTASLLLTAGADAKTRDKNGQSALAAAIPKNSTSLTQLLLTAGAELDMAEERDRRALRRARADIIRLVIEHWQSVGKSVHDEQIRWLFNAAAREGKNCCEVIEALSSRFPLAGIEFEQTALDEGLGAAVHCATIKAAVPYATIKDVRFLLEQGADANAATYDYAPPLSRAAEAGCLAIMETLLHHGAEVDRVENGGTALRSAAAGGQLAALRLLLARGADVNKLSMGRDTALAMATRCGQVAAVELLLEAGADVNLVGPDDKCGPVLLQAIESKGFGTEQEEVTAAIVRLFLERGADVNAVWDNYPHRDQAATALGRAARIGHLDVMRLLLDAGADVNFAGKGDTPLAEAANGGGIESMKVLIEHGADINQAGRGDLGTALAAAAHNGSEEAMKLLVERGADVNAIAGTHGSALAAATWSANDRAMRFLIAQGADVNAVGGGDGTALAAAAYFDNLLAMELLIRHGADVNKPGGRNGTPLGAAVSEEATRAALLLCEHGADVNAVFGKGDTALTTLITSYKWYDNVKKIVFLISLLHERGADMNHRGKRGSVLDMALRLSEDLDEKLCWCRWLYLRYKEPCIHVPKQREDWNAIIKALREYGAEHTDDGLRALERKLERRRQREMAEAFEFDDLDDFFNLQLLHV